MHPILGRLSHEVLLSTTCCTITLDRVSPRPHNIVQPGQLDNKGVIVVLKEGFRLQPGSEDGLEDPLSLFIMLFDYLLEAGVV